MSSLITPLTHIPDSGMDLDAYLGEIDQEILVKALAKTDGVCKGLQCFWESSFVRFVTVSPSLVSRLRMIIVMNS